MRKAEARAFAGKLSHKSDDARIREAHKAYFGWKRLGTYGPAAAFGLGRTPSECQWIGCRGGAVYAAAAPGFFIPRGVRGAGR